MNPLCHLLQRCWTGYCLIHKNDKTAKSHLLLMKDIKLYSQTKANMEKHSNLQQPSVMISECNLVLTNAELLTSNEGKYNPGIMW